MSDKLFIIAIDFGTTFSGVSWTWSGWRESNGRASVRHVQSWSKASNRSHKNHERVQVPTRIRYKNGKVISWGFNLEAHDTNDEITFEWFKLVLNYNELPEKVKNSEKVQSACRKLLAYNRWQDRSADMVENAATITADYLQLLWDSALEDISIRVFEGFLDQLDCKVIITRPTLWDNNACDLTRVALERALGKARCMPFRTFKIELVSEPEAAAFAELSSQEFARSLGIVKRDDIFILADAGGGTVDVVSYKITGVEPLELLECVKGDGDLCGSIFIDDEFELFLSVHMMEWNGLDSRSKRRVLNRDWEHLIKPEFDKQVLETWEMDVPGRMRPFEVTSAHLEFIFQPVCGKVRDLINKQVNHILQNERRLPKAIILVGGFGGSKYLHYVLRTAWQSRIEIIQPPDERPWTAVSRGAVMSAVERPIIKRVSRYSWGFCEDEEFDRDKHEIFQISVHPVTNESIVRGQMNWVIHKDTVLQHLEGAEAHVRYHIRHDAVAQGQFWADLWRTKQYPPPNKRNNDCDSVCKLLCELDCPFDSLPTCIDAAKTRFRTVEFDIIMIPNGEQVEFSVRFQGRRLPVKLLWPSGRQSIQKFSIPTVRRST